MIWRAEDGYDFSLHDYGIMVNSVDHSTCLIPWHCIDGSINGITETKQFSETRDIQGITGTGGSPIPEESSIKAQRGRPRKNS